ncbi:MAG: hypothetical protein AB7G21_14045, partial [Dehalococcoidia bacterium]
ARTRGVGAGEQERAATGLGTLPASAALMPPDGTRMTGTPAMAAVGMAAEAATVGVVAAVATRFPAYTGR